MITSRHPLARPPSNTTPQGRRHPGGRGFCLWNAEWNLLMDLITHLIMSLHPLVPPPFAGIGGGGAGGAGLIKLRGGTSRLEPPPHPPDLRAKRRPSESSLDRNIRNRRRRIVAVACVITSAAPCPQHAQDAPPPFRNGEPRPPLSTCCYKPTRHFKSAIRLMVAQDRVLLVGREGQGPRVQSWPGGGLCNRGGPTFFLPFRPFY